MLADTQSQLSIVEDGTIVYSELLLYYCITKKEIDEASFPTLSFRQRDSRMALRPLTCVFLIEIQIRCGRYDYLRSTASSFGGIASH